jgi:hypothetical protein
MSSALKNAAESTAHVLSDLVEGARDRIEDLPSIGHARHKRRGTSWLVVAIAGALGVVLLIVRHGRHSGGEAHAPASFDSASMAVSPS